MDEPFGALDEITKRAMQNELLALQKKLGMTVVFITHDIEGSDEIGRPGSCDGAGKDRAVRYAGKCKEKSGG